MSCFTDLLIIKDFDAKILHECSTRLLQNHIVLNSIVKPEVYGISPDRVKISYNDFAGYQFALDSFEENTFHISCFLPEISHDLDSIFRIISIINQLPQSKFSLYLTASICERFISYCNNHIDIIPWENRESLTVKTNLIVSYGLDVIHFLRNKIPVLVLGPFGLGGLVTPINISFLYRCGFMGRPGGILNERIPIELVAHELGILKDTKEINNLLNENKAIADAYPINPLSKEIIVQENLKKKIERLYNNNTRRNELKPKLCSNVKMVYSKDQLLLKRSHIHDTLCTVDKEDAAFFRDLNGTNTCGELKQKYGMNDEEFWNVVNIFLENQIILFNL